MTDADGTTVVRTPEEWGAAYAASHSRYVECARRVEGLIVDLLQSQGIDVIQVESRAKSVGSFVDKIRRKGRTDSDPMESVTDLIGLRVITYYIEDVARVGDLLAAEFSVDAENSMDKAQSLASDQFGYRSAHFVARLSSARVGLVEWKTFADLRIEFQVRTALQHAWAAVSHKLAYKSPEDAPAALQRRLYRLSALFELADEQFSILRDESQAADDAYRDDVSTGKLDIPIDASSISAYIQQERVLDGLRELLRLHEFKTEEIVPVDKDRLDRDRSDLVKVLRDYGFERIRDLDSYLSDVGRLKKIIEALNRHARPIDRDASTEDYLTQIIIVDRDTSDMPGDPIYTAEHVMWLKQVRDELAAEA